MLAINIDEDTAPLTVTRLANGKRKLQEPLRFSVTARSSDGILRTNYHEVPAGFETDYSSIPRAFSWVVRWSRVDIAGVIHDYFYQRNGITRREADLIWRTVATMGDHSANRAQAYTCYAGLRVGGWVVWRRYRRLDDSVRSAG